jgi:hypothetical protein
MALAKLGVALGVLLSVGCSHPATEAECEIIFRKTAELTLRERTQDSAVIEERIEAYRRTHGDKEIAKCLGKALSKNALACIEKADSESKVNDCLR